MKGDFVSVVIPVRNEEGRIAGCLDSIVAQTYPKEDLEVLLVDGRSEDSTRKIISEYEKAHPYIRALDNPAKIVPAALNEGIKASKGDVIIRMDAHAYYDAHYIARCVETLKKVDASNVGGPIVTLPGGETAKAKAIALATAHPFGVGNSKFRTSVKAQYVDTVPFGAFRREVFERVGLFNEKLARNQDIEFNSRMRKAGERIFLDPDIRSYYYNRAALGELWRQNFANGMWNVFTEGVSRGTLSARHYVPFIFVMSLLGSAVLAFFHPVGLLLLSLVAGSYLLLNIFFSLRIGSGHGSKTTALLPLVFCTLHFSYGLGFLAGFLRLRRWKGN